MINLILMGTILHVITLAGRDPADRDLRAVLSGAPEVSSRWRWLGVYARPVVTSWGDQR